MDFEFDHGTCEGLIKLVGSLPVELKEERRLNLKIGRSIEQISFTNFLKLLDTAYNRVNVNADDVPIKYMIQQSPDHKIPHPSD